VSRIEHLARTYWFDLLIALLTIVAILNVVVGRGSSGAPTTTLWFCLPALAILALPLFARRRFPFAGPAAYWLLAAGASFIDPLLIPFPEALFLLGLAAAFLLGNLRDVRRAGLGLAIVVGATATLIYNVPGHSVDQLVFIPVDFAVAWVAGLAVRARAEQAEVAESHATQAEQQAEVAESHATQAEQERDAATRVAVAEERVRIARELHDIVAHAVSVMVLQVGAVRHHLPDAMAEDRDALRGVEQAGRGALAEMRRLLSVMRRDGDGVEFAPQPGLDGLDSLVKEIGRAGLPVELHLDGERFPLPAGIDLSAYRIVQEGLTNALKHARASHAEVTVRYAPDEVGIEVRDDGTGATPSDGYGHGLIGIRERVKLYGGEMTAGMTNGGGFTLSTRLPLTPDRP
jgi:signal transduction histidine kinase